MSFDPGSLLARARSLKPIARFVPKRADVRYQPILNVRAGSIVGFQAFASNRGPHLDHGPVDDDAVLSLAQLRAVLLRVGADARKWRGIGLAPPRVIIALGEEACSSEGLASLIAQSSQATGLEVAGLEFVVPEVVAMNAPGRGSPQFVAIQELNANVSMNLVSDSREAVERAQLLGFVGVRVDSSRLAADEEAQRRATVALAAARNAGLVVTATRVRSLAELRVVVPLGCDRMQGDVVAGVSQPDAMTARLTTDQASAEQAGPAPLERRSTLRLPLLLFPEQAERMSADTEETLPVEAAVVDLSEDGMQLRLAVPLQDQEGVRLTFLLPGDADPEPIRVQLHPVAQQPLGAGYRVNAQYVGISLMERSRIMRFIAREEARRDRPTAA